METANVAITFDQKVIPERVQNSNPDQLQLTRPLPQQQQQQQPQQQQRFFPSKSFDGVGAKRRELGQVLANTVRVETSLEKRFRSIEIVPEPILAENIEPTRRQHFII
jgi:hypothetical protein